MRSTLDEANEKKSEGCNTVRDIRCIAESDPHFKEAFADSMASVLQRMPSFAFVIL